MDTSPSFTVPRDSVIIGKKKNGSDLVAESNSGVPRISVIGIDRALPAAELFDVVGHRDVRQVFQALIPELARHAQAQRPGR